MSPEPNHRPTTDAEALGEVRDSETVHHASRRGDGDRRGRVGQLNLTSMMDVTFQLLIFFVLTAAFALNEGVLRADLPTGPPKPKPVEIPKEPIEVTLRRHDAQVFIDVNGQQVGSLSGLYDFLSRNNQGENPNGIYSVDEPVVIKPKGDVSWDDVFGAFNAATRAKFTNIAFAKANSG